MKIHEYQAKEILRKYGVDTPRGLPCFSVDEAVEAARKLGGGIWVVKAQIHAGGRGKGGGVKVAKSPDEVKRYASQILGMQLKTHQTGPAGQKVRRLLIEDSAAFRKVIERTAPSGRFDLVITGVAREGPFSNRPIVLGKTVEQLLRRLPIPILIVKNRPRDPYQHIVVATDFSKPSAHALQMALLFLPVQPLYLLHASEAPYSTLADDSKLHAERYRMARAEELREFLTAIFLPDDDRKRIIPMIEPGHPKQIIREYVQMHGGDLVVLGTHGRGAVMEAIVGSTTKSILSTLPCDALVVRGPPN